MVDEIFSNRWTIGIISYFVFIMSASAHEYSHARVAYNFGDKTARDLGRLTFATMVFLCY